MGARYTMNQILTNKKIYVTPELKKKKKFYKFDFVMSIFLVCILFSFYIYAEYDRNKSEEMSRDILSNLIFEESAVVVEDDTTMSKSQFLLIVLEPGSPSLEDEIFASANNAPEVYVPDIQYDVQYSEGLEYYTVATINIPKLNVYYPVLSRTSESLLKISPTKFW